MFVNEKRILVEWGDCDPAGIVFFANYLSWFDDCTTALFLAAGMPIAPLFRQYGIIGIPLVDVRARFILPSTFGDELSVASGATEFHRSSFVIRHQFFQRKELAVEGFETRVWTALDPLNSGKMKSRALPAEVIQKLSKARDAGR